MKKSVFISLALFCFSENVFCMQSNDFINIGSPSVNPSAYSELATGVSDISAARSDLSDQAEVFIQIENLNSQVLGLTQLLQALNDKLTALTSQNSSLKSENDALHQQISDMQHSSEQQLMAAQQRANELAVARARQEEEHRRSIEARRASICSQMESLRKQRAEEVSYVDGTKPYPRGSTLFHGVEAERREYDRRHRLAPGKIKDIDTQLENLRAQLNSLH